MPENLNHGGEALTWLSHIGTVIGGALAGLGIGHRRGAARARDECGSKDVVAAISGLERTFRDEGEKTRKAVYDTAQKTEARLARIAEDTKVLLDRDRAR